MRLVCLSISFEKNDLARRGKFALQGHDQTRLCNYFIDHGATEALCLSTCNRVETYLVFPKKFSGDCTAIYADYLQIDKNHFCECLDLYPDAKALEHLFALACGARSLVVGETEILGQLKQAYAVAVAENLTGKILNRTFQRAFSVAKQIRTGTDIGRYRVSVANTTVEAALDNLKKYDAPVITVWGTGTVGRAVLQALADNGYSKGIILTRNPAKFYAAPKGWRIEDSHNFKEKILSSDFLFTCTGAPHPVLHPSDLTGLNNPLYIYDIAVPRDTSPDLAGIEKIHLFDMDTLAKLISQNRSTRQSIKEEILPILADEAQKFWRCLNAAIHEKCLADWRVDAHELLETEMDSLCNEWPDMPEEIREKFHAMANKLMHRMLHWPSQSLQRAIRDGLPCADFFTDFDK